MNFVVKRAKESDLKKISEICDESISDPFGLKGFIELFKESHIIILKCLSDSVIIGYVVLSVVGDEAEILSIATAKDFRRKGCAKLLIKEGFRLIKESKVKKIFLEVRQDNICAINFYRGLGFKIIAERKNYYKDKKTALVMTVEL